MSAALPETPKADYEICTEEPSYFCHITKPKVIHFNFRFPSPKHCHLLQPEFQNGATACCFQYSKLRNVAIHFSRYMSTHVENCANIQHTGTKIQPSFLQLNRNVSAYSKTQSQIHGHVLDIKLFSYMASLSTVYQSSSGADHGFIDHQTPHYPPLAAPNP